MMSADWKAGIFFLLQVSVGILGNLSLLGHYTSLYLSRCRLRPVDVILGHLTVANCLVILSRGMTKIMEMIHWQRLNNNYGCVIVLYVHRVARGVSMGSTCLLSVFQVIIINPRKSRWAETQTKATRYVGPCNVLCWALHLLVNVTFPLYVLDKFSSRNSTQNKHRLTCGAAIHDKVMNSLFATFLSCHDASCLGVMTWASSCMVFILYKHRKQVQHIRSNHHSPRSSAETRATQSVIILVSTFVLCYALSSIIFVYIAVFDRPSSWLVNIAAIITSCFPMMSPFVLMWRERSSSRLCCVRCERNK
ncbi:vomeronasal type-1 receptor 2-like [Ochotona princeps]|uniref:vomeronasal type-1 receptor 2-like n=1 Tax=Ochotona princeps TaxID=9978 RepID=UPI002714ABE0|nr:vomeronasal type-1 receptor 2-like [Ochotona princeps]